MRQPFGIIGFGRVQGFAFQRSDRKQGHGGYAQFDQFGSFLQEQVNGQPFDPRHRCHCFTLAVTFEDEHRIDQVVYAELGFAHQAAGKVIATDTAQAGGGKLAIGWIETHWNSSGSACAVIGNGRWQQLAAR